MTKNILQIEKLSYRYESDLVLDNVQFSVQKGEFVGIVGANGTGKSTLLKLILQIIKLQQGEIKLFETSLPQFRNWEKVGFVSQKANAFNTGFPATVEEVVVSGLVSNKHYFGLWTKADKEKCKQALELVDMKEYVYRNIGELSGGQQQRVFIARALVNQPALLIFDEPTVGIDDQHLHEFYQLIKDLNVSEQITILMSTHDTEEITKYASRIISLQKTVIFDGCNQEFSKLRSKEFHEQYGCIHEEAKL